MTTLQALVAAHPDHELIPEQSVRHDGQDVVLQAVLTLTAVLRYPDGERRLVRIDAITVDGRRLRWREVRHTVLANRSARARGRKRGNQTQAKQAAARRGKEEAA